MEERLLALLRLALKYNATDIHFDVKYQDVLIEMRIDGLCHKVKNKFEDYKLIRYLQYLAFFAFCGHFQAELYQRGPSHPEFQDQSRCR